MPTGRRIVRPDPRYMVAYGGSIQALEQEVNLLLEAGWKCQGGVTSNGDHPDLTTCYCQAMVKEPSK